VAGDGGARVTAELSAASALSVVRVHPDDPLAAPLFAELAVEYDRRYGDLFGGAADELTRYPVTEFLPPDGDLVLLLADGGPVAGGAFRRHADPGTAEVKRMWTAASHRRRGLARRVITELETRAAAVGYRRMYLTTGPRQPEARGLYLAAGWTPLFDPAVPRPTDIETLRRLPVAERLYAFEKSLGVPA
jgi:GNAT superfamily N-acetyltransferase